jgi:hypothetical protein
MKPSHQHVWRVMNRFFALVHERRVKILQLCVYCTAMSGAYVRGYGRV